MSSRQGRQRKPPFIPKPARLELRIHGASVFRLRLEDDHARTLLETLRKLRGEWIPAMFNGEPATDENVADALVASTWSHFGDLKTE